MNLRGGKTISGLAGVLFLSGAFLMTPPSSFSEEDDLFGKLQSSFPGQQPGEASPGGSTSAHLGDLRDSYLSRMRGEEPPPAEEPMNLLNSSIKGPEKLPLATEKPEAKVPGADTTEPFLDYQAFGERERARIYQKPGSQAERRRFRARHEQPAYRFSRRMRRGIVTDAYEYPQLGLSDVPGQRPRYTRKSYFQKLDRYYRMQRLNYLYRMREKMIARNASYEQVARIEKRIQRLRVGERR